MPPSAWRLVDRHILLREALAAGVSLVEREPIPPDVRLWSFPEESMRVLCDLAVQEPELLDPLR